MSEEIGMELSERETEQFLTDRGLGVLGFANGGEAYTIPIVFAYDADENRCILRFIMAEDSKKRRFAAETERASLTVYEWRQKNHWKSVVIEGPLRQIPDDELAQAAALFSTIGEEAALEVFNDPISSYETVWYELSISDLTARGRDPGTRDRSL